jgi:hypothetical protein
VTTTVEPASATSRREVPLVQAGADAPHFARLTLGMTTPHGSDAEGGVALEATKVVRHSDDCLGGYGSFSVANSS